MSRYWVVGLIVAVVVAIYFCRRMWKAPRVPSSVDLPLWEEDRHRPPNIKSDEMDDDTEPAVLSPPEVRPPRSVSNGWRH